jgi:hypothetical protein
MKVYHIYPQNIHLTGCETRNTKVSRSQQFSDIICRKQIHFIIGNFSFSRQYSIGNYILYTAGS